MVVSAGILMGRDDSSLTFGSEGELTFEIATALTRLAAKASAASSAVDQ